MVPICGLQDFFMTSSCMRLLCWVPVSPVRRAAPVLAGHHSFFSPLSLFSRSIMRRLTIPMGPWPPSRLNPPLSGSDGRAGGRKRHLSKLSNSKTVRCIYVNWEIIGLMGGLSNGPIPDPHTPYLPNQRSKTHFHIDSHEKPKNCGTRTADMPDTFSSRQTEYFGAFAAIVCTTW